MPILGCCARIKGSTCIRFFYVFNVILPCLGAMDPRCKLCIFMGKTDPSASKHKQQVRVTFQMVVKKI